MKGHARNPAALDGATGAVVILSLNPIHDTGGGQRSAQLALEFLARDCAVLFVHSGEVTETVDLRLVFDEHRLERRSLVDVTHGASASLLEAFLRYPGSLVLTQAAVSPWLAVLSTAHAMGAVTVYDLIDDWNTELGDGWYRRRNESRVAARTDLLIASAPVLQRNLAARLKRDVALIPNAFNSRIFAGHRADPRPADLPPGPIALYVGSLWGGWIDWELVRALADAMTEAQFVFIGDYRGEGGALPTNCLFLGLKPQRELPRYLSHADVGLLPWNEVPMTRAASPLKIFEYVAMGLRVIAPDLEPVAGIPGVVRCGSRTTFLEATHASIVSKPDEAELRSMVKFSAENSWTQRVDALLSLVTRARREPWRPGLGDRLRAWVGQ